MLLQGFSPGHLKGPMSKVSSSMIVGAAQVQVKDTRRLWRQGDLKVVTPRLWTLLPLHFLWPLLIPLKEAQDLPAHVCFSFLI